MVLPSEHARDGVLRLRVTVLLPRGAGGRPAEAGVRRSNRGDLAGVRAARGAGASAAAGLSGAPAAMGVVGLTDGGGARIGDAVAVDCDADAADASGDGAGARHR